MISYTPFYNTISKKKISTYQLEKDFLFPKSTFKRIRNNESITLKTIEMLCKVLNCNINDIVTIV